MPYIYVPLPHRCGDFIYTDVYTPNMDILLKKYAGLVESGEIEINKEIPQVFTFDELEYLHNNGFIYDDGSTFIAIETDDLE